MTEPDRCTNCSVRLTQRELEIGTGLCDACGHADTANVRADADDARRRAFVDAVRMGQRLQRQRRRHAWAAHERFARLVFSSFPN